MPSKSICEDQRPNLEKVQGDGMKRFEYEITKHQADEFKQFIYFCTDQGECDVNGLPSGQLDRVGDLLNEKGSEGWELVQIFPGKDGIVGFWKREIQV